MARTTIRLTNVQTGDTHDIVRIEKRRTVYGFWTNGREYPAVYELRSPFRTSRICREAVLDLLATVDGVTCTLRRVEA